MTSIHHEAYKRCQGGGPLRILHTSDLHLGKRLHETSLADDQRHMLKQIVQIARCEKPDIAVVAGDVYDRAVPSEESVTMFGEFLSELSAECRVFVIAGNHDSGARLDYCDDLLVRSGVHIAGRFSGKAERVTVADEYGDVDVWLLPYFRVSEVRSLSGERIDDYGKAMDWVLAQSGVDPSRRNVLVAHQFFAGSSGVELSDSEEQRPEVGGLTNIPVDKLDAFDYVALGHLHLPQRVGRDTVRYSGSPLKYSASEARRPKSVCIVELRAKDSVAVRTVPIVPLHDVREIRGRLPDLIRAAGEDPVGRDDYIYVSLTETPAGGVDEIYRAYPNTLQVRFELPGSEGELSRVDPEAMARESVSELFSRFYKEVTGTDLTESQWDTLRECEESYGRDSE